MTYRIIHVSRNDGLDGKALRVLCTSAAIKNEKSGITGALVLRDGWFIQLLEGDREAVARTVSRIGRDPRHSEFKIVCAQACTDRLFPMNWIALTESGSIVDRVFRKVFHGLDFNPWQCLSDDFRRLFEELSAADLVALEAEPDDIALV